MSATINTQDPSRPDFLRAEVVAARRDLTLIHHLLEGTRAMHAHYAEYVKAWPKEESATHYKRGTSEQLYEGLSRTVSAAVGKIFAKPPKLEYPTDEATLAAHWENLDLAGTKGDVAAKWFVRDGVTDGYGIILVDHPARPDGKQVTAANEVELGLRPFWAFYAREAVCSWRTDRLKNRAVITQLVLHEPTELPLGLFGVTTVHFYRELWVRDGVAGYTLWRAPVKEGEAFTQERTGVFKNRLGATRDTLPIAVGYTDKAAAPLVAKPPLLPVAWANLGHYQQAANLRYYRELAAFPQPVIIGQLVGPPDEHGAPTAGVLRLGPGVAQHLTGEGADFKWAELSGTALEQVEAGVRAKEEQMAKLGLAFLQHDTRAAETAEAKRLDAAAEDSTLATAAQGLEDALNLAWEHHAWFMGLAKAQAPRITLNRDYSGTVLTAQQTQAIAALVREGLPTLRAVQALIAGGVLTANEDEAEAIAMEWDGGLDDAAEQREARLRNAGRALDGGVELPRAA